MSKAVCPICPHHCVLSEGEVGRCRARQMKDGNIICQNYGHVTALALDPIEKKPLRRFFPGTRILSVGSFGCNFCCSFCQNFSISTADVIRSDYEYISPEKLVEMGIAFRAQENIGLAFTYNEPLVGYEYVLDTSRLAKAEDLKTVVVTNGYICPGPLLELLPSIDAMNIDLKSFSESFYKQIGGDLETVKRTIELASAGCHVEVTTLIIPDENDQEEEIRNLCQFLADIDKDMPLHLTRFYPHYEMKDKPPTSPKTIQKLANIAREMLTNVYAG